MTTDLGRALTREHLRDPVLLLDITWAGRTFRFASESVDVAKADGSLLRYEGGIELRWDESVDMEGGLPDEDIDLGEVVFPIDVALWHRQGKPLVGAKAELSWWTSGRSYESRQRLMVGTVTATSYGPLHHPVSLSLLPPSLEDTATYPPDDAVASTDTWATVDAAIDGTPYPFVFGSPGLGLTGGSERLAATGGSPAVLVDATYTSGSDVGKWVVNGAPSSAASVRLINATQGESEVVSIATTTDGLGRVVSWVTATSGTITVDVGHDYWCDWSGTDGGVVGPDGGAIAGAGDIAIALLRLSTVPYDEGAWRAQVPALNRYKFDFYVDSPESPFSFLRDEILALLPFGLGRTVDGVAPIPYALGLPKSAALVHLEQGRNCEVEDYPVSDLDSMVNEVTVRFAPRADDGEFYRTRTASWRPLDTDNPDRFPVFAARVSRTMLDRHSAEVLDATFVYDSTTADLIAAAVIADRAIPPERLTLSVQERFTDLRAGAAVLFTSEELYWNEVVAQVEDVVREGSRLLIGVRIRANVAQDARPF